MERKQESDFAGQAGSSDGQSSWASDFLAFRKMITPDLVEVLYVLFTLAVVLWGVLRFFQDDPADKVLAVVIIAGGTLAVRIVFEVWILFFKIHEAVSSSANTLSTMMRQIGRLEEQLSKENTQVIDSD